MPIIPTVSAEYLMEANNQHTEDYELWLEDPDLYPEPDGMDAVISALKDRASADAILAVWLRLYALQHSVTEYDDLAPWLSKDVNEHGKMLIGDALYRA